MNENQLLRKNALFHDLSDDDLKKLLGISNKITMDEEDFLIREGEMADNFYFILSGNIEISKLDADHEHEHLIAYLGSGDTVGEMSLLDHKPRSASAKATTKAELLGIPFDGLQELAQPSPSFDSILRRITENITSRMRQTNTTVVAALEKQLKEYKMRAGLGTFMINSILAVCLFSFFLAWITKQENGAIASTAVSLPLTLGFVALFFSIVKSSKLPLSTFGLTTKNWGRSVTESILFTLILCALIELTKWILIHHSQQYMGQPLFEPYITLHLQQGSGHLSKQDLWWMIMLVYCLVISPLQELIVRGGLQGPLEVFLPGKHSIAKAILVSNFMFSTSHLFLGINVALMVFLAGLYFGWLYSRHHTLIGVIIAHGMLGVWATMVVGF